MAQLFHRRANAIAKASIIAVALGVVSLAAGMYAVQRSEFWTRVEEPLPQPVPFSHEHHVAGLGIDCRYCHTSVETSS
ncbi:MAG: cytochrome c3 family protein, partial [Chthoniobacteraceae bacterium]